MSRHRAIITLVPMRPAAGDHGDPATVGREVLASLRELLPYFHVELDEDLLDEVCTVQPCEAELERRTVAGYAVGIGVNDAAGSRPYRAAWNAYWIELALAIDDDAVNQHAQEHGFFAVQPRKAADVIASGPVLIETRDKTLLQVVRADDGSVMLVSDEQQLRESALEPETAEAARAALWAHRGTDGMTRMLWPSERTEHGLCCGLDEPDARSSALWYLGKVVHPTATSLERVLGAPYAADEVSQARDVAAHLARALGEPALPILRTACERADLQGALALWAFAEFASGRHDETRAEAEARVAAALGSMAKLHCEQALELVGRLRLRSKAVVAAAALRASDPDDELAHAALLGLFNLFHRDAGTPPHVARAFANAARREDKIGAFARWALAALPRTDAPS